MKRLTPAQRAAFDADGYVAPVDAFSIDEAVQGTRRIEALLAPFAGRPNVRLRNNPHLLLRWMADLAHDRRVLDAAEDVLGPDLLILRRRCSPSRPAISTTSHGIRTWRIGT